MPYTLPEARPASVSTMAALMTYTVIMLVVNFGSHSTNKKPPRVSYLKHLVRLMRETSEQNRGGKSAPPNEFSYALNCRYGISRYALTEVS
jgi:hypothetical protein